MRTDDGEAGAEWAVLLVRYGRSSGRLSPIARARECHERARALTN